MMKNVIKIVIILCFLISLILSIKNNITKIKIPYFNGVYRDVIVDVIFDKKIPKVFFDDKEIKPTIKIDENHYQYKKYHQNLIHKITFKDNSNIKQLIIFNGNDVQFFPKNQNIIKIDNNKNILDKFSIIFLSFFYNFYFYILAYIFLIIYLMNFKIKYNHTSIFFLILFLGLILRCSQLNYIPFWDDEIYILSHSANYAKITDLFNDPGNPPLYFILFKIYRFFIHNPNFYRFSSVILGIVFNIIFYFNIKHWLNRKKALVGLFIVTITMAMIYFSQEIRCYMLLMILSLLNSLFLFKFNNRKNKNIYLFSSICLFYTHFYGTFVVLYNFIFGSLLYKNKTCKLKSFILVNLISFLTFIPLLIYKFNSLTSSFNSWIVKPELLDYIQTFAIFINPTIWFLLFVVMVLFILFKTKNIKEKLLIKYNFCAIFFVMFTSACFSYLIKPIFLYRYFYVIYPHYLVLVTYLITRKYKLKFQYLLKFLILIICITKAQLNYQNLFCNHNLYLKFIENDIGTKKNNYIFVSDTIKGYKEFENKFKNKAEIIYLPVNQGIDTLYLENYNFKKPNNIYVLNLYLSKYSYNIVKNIELYKTPLGIFCKIEN